MCPSLSWQSGETPLHVAARNCHYAVARSLLDHWRKLHPDDSGAALVNAQNEVSKRWDFADK